VSAAQVSALRAELAESKAALAAQANAFDKERAALQAELDALKASTVSKSAMEETLPHELAGRVARLFALIDTDSSGAISATELDAFFAKCGQDGHPFVRSQ
jgi:hypothetical protein